MIQIKYIRDNLEKVKSSIKNKNVNFDINEIIILDDKRKKNIIKVESLKSQRNKINKLISDAKKNNENASELIK